MTRPMNDPVTERGRRIVERLQRREAFQQAVEEIQQDLYFPRVLRRVVEEAIRLQTQQCSDEGSRLSSLWEAESLLQTLATGDDDSEALSALESESYSKKSVQSNYRNSHDTPDDPEEDDSEHTPTPESTNTLTILPAEKKPTPPSD